ncbi:MAG: helix-turn-helix domain-containing protein [Planctomycetota bacterium]|nr:helix-turn-helix domain-containing protein [Planctomycetota bacterium]
MKNASLRPDDVITLPQAASLLGVGPTTLKRWSDQGRLPHTRTPGGHRRFLRSVILDFRTVVDPRAGAHAHATPLTLRLGAPCEWVDRVNTLADADRMEAALGSLRATSRGWGPAADEVLNDFVYSLRVRQRDGRVSAGSWAALVRSLERSVQRLAGQMRPRVGGPVALLASPGGCAGPVLLALAEAVLREAGYTVLDVGCLQEPGVLEEIIAEQQPHQVVLLADGEVGARRGAPRHRGVARGRRLLADDRWRAPRPVVRRARRPGGTSGGAR